MNCEDIKDFEDIIWENREEIIRQAWANTDYYNSGVAQIGVDDGKLYYCGFGSNEVENPANRVVEVYRIDRGFDAESCAGCSFCDDSNDGYSCSDEKLDECVMDSLMEEFNYNFDGIMGEIYNDIQEFEICNDVQEFGYDL